MNNNSNTNTIYNNPTINGECYVAFLDILGFSAMVRTASPVKIKQMLCNLVDRENLFKNVRFSSIGNTNKAVDILNSLHENLYVCNISDSIILAINNSDAKNLEFLLKICFCIQWLLFDKYQMIIRGAVSMGSFFGNSIVAIGNGLMRANELEEEKAKNPRIIIDKDLIPELQKLYYNEDHTAEKNEVFNSDDFDYKLMVDPEDGFWYVRWLWNFNSADVWKYCKSEIDKLDQLDPKFKNKAGKYLWIFDKIKADT